VKSNEISQLFLMANISNESDVKQSYVTSIA